jgi:hypothetical protein
MLTLLDCTHTGRLPSVYQLLILMDTEEPAVDAHYIDTYSDMNDFGLEDVLDVYDMDVCYLATFGNLGRNGAQCLRQYARDKILVPLSVLKGKSSEASIEEIDMTQEGRIMEWRVSVRPGSVEEIEDIKSIKKEKEVGGENEVEDVEEVGEETTDVADDIEEGSDVAYGTQEEV